MKQSKFHKTKPPKKVEVQNYISFQQDIINPVFIEIGRLYDVDLLPNDGQTFFITTFKQSPITDFVKDRDITDLYIFCAAMNEKSLKEVVEKTKGILYRGETLTEKIKNNFKSHIEKHNIKTKPSKNHVKLIAFKQNENFYVMDGSGNPSNNSRNENYILYNSKRLFQEVVKFFKNA